MSYKQSILPYIFLTFSRSHDTFEGCRWSQRQMLSEPEAHR